MTPLFLRSGKFLIPALLALAGCGDLPQPFLGRPGATAERLSQPPPSRLAVPTPAQSLLPEAGATAWAGAVADALVAEEVPAMAGGAQRRRTDWTLQLSADVRGTQVVPSYSVQNPSGEAQGSAEGAPVAMADWAGGDPAVLKAAAEQAAPSIAALLGRIEAARRQSDPNSLLNRPARIYFSGVTGAPGDGGTSLPTQMRTKLTAMGLVIQDTANGADFTLAGQVQTATGAKGTTRIELEWIVADSYGAERGRILQLNEVPPGTLDRYWGDVAVVVADEAAGGVRDVVLNSTGARNAAKPAPETKLGESKSEDTKAGTGTAK